MSTYDSAKGLAMMNEALLLIEARIKQYEGHFKVNMQPKVVSEIDDAELARKMADLERVNAEVDGDEFDSNETDSDEVDFDEFKGDMYVKNAS